MLSFAAPLILTSLLVLPVIWYILRIRPPAPRLFYFPAMRLLSRDADTTPPPAKIPWWLLLLRLFAAACVIFALAKPHWRATSNEVMPEHVILIFDDGYAAAPDWEARVEQAHHLLDQANAHNSLVALLPGDMTQEKLVFTTPQTAKEMLAARHPQPWPSARSSLEQVLASAPETASIYWLSDGIAQADDAAFFDRLARFAQTNLSLPEHNLAALIKSEKKGNGIEVGVASSGALPSLTLIAAGGQTMRDFQHLARMQLDEIEEGHTDLTLALQGEQLNRLRFLRLEGQPHAGAVRLADHSFRHPKIAVLAARKDEEAARLTDSLHYIRAALAPDLALTEASWPDLAPTQPDMLILPDNAVLHPDDAAAIEAHIAEGATLIRFAGPVLAGQTVQQMQADPFLPVRLRFGGRDLEGPLIWDRPKKLAPFPEQSLFSGLALPDDVVISQQIIAEPSPDLADKTLALLEDGTPLVTQQKIGDGRLVLFHVPATPNWSNLPLSEIFVQMIRQLAQTAQGGSADIETPNGSWTPLFTLDGYGQIHAAKDLPTISSAQFAARAFGPDFRPGLYRSGAYIKSADLLDQNDRLAPLDPPSFARLMTQGADGQGIDLFATFMLAALLLYLLDWLFSIRETRHLGLAMLAAFSLLTPDSYAQDAHPSLQTSIGYFSSGDAGHDRLVAQGLAGLKLIVEARTATTLAPAQKLVPGESDLTPYPLIYWPVKSQLPLENSKAMADLATFMETGGMLLIDTADANQATGPWPATPAQEQVRKLLSFLPVPRLAKLPENHVLSRSFYLLNLFPGRYMQGDLLVDNVTDNADRLSGQVNDGVSGVVIGANDWAAAWALDDNGRPVARVGSGLQGERQREYAYRFGVNLVIYALTGNYKADQIHVPALLERLK